MRPYIKYAYSNSQYKPGERKGRGREVETLQRTKLPSQLMINAGQQQQPGLARGRAAKCMWC